MNSARKSSGERIWKPIGNFNRTMRNYGWGRQFRGQINGLMVFGSRIGQRGALDLKTIQTLK